MRIIIFGSKGWIGSQFVDVLKNTSFELCVQINQADRNTLLSEYVILYIL